MTESDLIVAVPWIAFAAALAIVCTLLLRSGRASRSAPGHPLPPPSPDPAAQHRGGIAGERSAQDSGQDQHEAGRSERHPTARLR